MIDTKICFWALTCLLGSACASVKADSAVPQPVMVGPVARIGGAEGLSGKPVASRTLSASTSRAGGSYEQHDGAGGIEQVSFSESGSRSSFASGFSGLLDAGDTQHGIMKVSEIHVESCGIFGLFYLRSSAEIRAHVVKFDAPD